MNLIIRNAKIVDSGRLNGTTTDIHIVDGIIKTIGSDIKNDNKCDELSFNNLHVSPGWFDTSVSFGEPGFEERETISNGLQVAAKNGFAAIALQPNTFPVADNQSVIHLISTKSMRAATTVFPIGALTKNSEGKDLAELFDMKSAGAVGFGDYNKNLDDSNLMKIALQYVQDFGGLPIAFSLDSKLKGNGVVNEGESAMKLGLKGIPAIAEELQVSRNISILEYTGGRLHIPTISTKNSVELIRAAKKKGLSVTCSVAVHNLVLTDQSLETFDSRYKVLPPLRTEEDRLALIEGVNQGVIDAVTSDHNPIDIENKKVEFDNAMYGTVGLESTFGTLNTVLPLNKTIEVLTAGWNLFGMDKPLIQQGEKACLTLFIPEGEWIFDKEHINSKSKNSAFLGLPQKGFAAGLINNGQLITAEKLQVMM